VRSPPRFHGLLAIDKPRGWTSHDVVARVRRLAGQREVGHGGTLDPMATGLLPLGLGQGTRVLEYLLGGRKRYEATVLLGAATDSYDAEGTVTSTAPWQHVTEPALREALQRFTGEIAQHPPIYSAIKHGGQPLHRLVRRGEQVETSARQVVVYAIELGRVALPEIDLRIECGAGTYVRSLAHDLGAALGSAAHLVALRRTATGLLSIDQAVPLSDLESSGDDGIASALLSLDRPLWLVPAVIVDPSHARDICHGTALPSHPGEGAWTPREGELCRAYSAGGDFLAVLRYSDERRSWRPQKVFATAKAEWRDTGIEGDSNNFSI